MSTVIIIIKRISTAPIYRRALYKNTNNTHPDTHARTHKHVKWEGDGGGGAIGTAVKKTV